MVSVAGLAGPNHPTCDETSRSRLVRGRARAGARTAVGWSGLVRPSSQLSKSSLSWALG